MRDLKKVAVLLFVLGGACACSRTDTGSAGKWLRTVEPRLRGAEYRPCRRKPPEPGRVVQDADCGVSAVPSEQRCDRIENTRAEAVRMLALLPRCTDEALQALETFARTDATVWSDVAAAYYVRAQREDRASDLLHAYEAADRAVRVRQNDRVARFNLALIEEAIGLREQAAVSWRILANEDSDWGKEAREHLQRLEQQLARSAAEQWESNRSQLANAIRTGDATAVAALIRPFPRSALHYFEDEVLPDGDPDRLYARQLSARLANDRFAVDVAAAAAANRDGHRLFREARKLEKLLLYTAAVPLYARAVESLRRGGSPMYLRAALGHALTLSFERGREADALAILDPVETEAQARGYEYLAAFMSLTRASIRYRQSRYLESIADADAARQVLTRLDDRETLASYHRSNAGTYGVMGQYEVAWRDALQGLRYAPFAVETRIRHAVMGEAASAAMLLEQTNIAALYQTSILEALRKQLTEISPERTDLIATQQRQVSIALRQRARIDVETGDYVSARSDLRDAMRLAQTRTRADSSTARQLDARMAALEGEALLKIDPIRSAAAFTRALSLIDEKELRSFRTSVLVQRSQAYRIAGATERADQDLEAALRELRAEEQQILATRRVGQGEKVWTSYFGRFREPYERLIGQLVQQGRQREAFTHAERARAFEPLDLVLRLPHVPDEFRELTRGGNPMALEDIQRNLPGSTFVLQYVVAEKNTYAWIIARDAVGFVELDVQREDIERWSMVLQRAGRRGDAETFDTALDAPYEKLIARPLAEVDRIVAGKRPARLVIIPDGAMHGLPFGALRNPNTRRHLIEYAPIEIAAGATLYVFSLLRSSELASPAPSALLIGDPAFDESSALAYRLDRLPAAAREVDEIAQFYQPRVDVVKAEKATVREFLARAQDKTIVHFAGHAIVNPQEPSRSVLLLARTPESSGAIEAQDLLTHLKLDRTRLVVLSACSSAGGLPVGPEGVGPLMRPLVAAGVPAVIGSLWDVEDATAKVLFVSFHRHYRQGSDAAAALRAAQVELLRNNNPGLRPALAWSSFEVIGHASSPFETTNTTEEHLVHTRSNSVLRNARLRAQ